MRVIADNAWVQVPNTTIDAAANRASAAITAPGNYGVGMAPSSAPCTAAPHRQFDFRIGTFAWEGPNGLSGTAVIAADADGCAIRETLTMSNGATTRAVFFYEPSDAQWHYTSLTGSNATRLSGGLDAGRMILYNPSRVTRVVWEAQGPNHTQTGESAQNGAWTVLGSGTFVRQ
jgi:hypothetical protein